jgi:hypothetical protein
MRVWIIEPRNIFFCVLKNAQTKHAETLHLHINLSNFHILPSIPKIPNSKQVVLVNKNVYSWYTYFWNIS